MMPNTYDRDRMAQAHRQDLLREAAQERLVAQLSRPERSTPRPIAQFKILWSALRFRFRHGFQRRPA
jgi:hypothetical protein